MLSDTAAHHAPTTNTKLYTLNTKHLYLPRPPPLREPPVREPPAGEPKPLLLEVEVPLMPEDVEERLVLRLDERFILLLSERPERSEVAPRLTVRSEERLAERSVTLLVERLAVPFVERSVTRL